MSQQFGSFEASELHCPKCKSLQRVREKLLLVLPTGNLFDYSCVRCGTSLGKRTVTGPPIAPASGSALPGSRPPPTALAGRHQSFRDHPRRRRG